MFMIDHICVTIYIRTQHTTNQQKQDKIIKGIQQRKSSILLVGRSGTGKTTIAVGRMGASHSQRTRIMENLSPEEKDASENAYHQVFVTANAVLRDQVCVCVHV